ncbi:MAG TPA: Nif3-like dinuclear metal center hexameric protein [Acidobacteriota bacterium]|nr:Nif3-like dinuclear metal center hexameric protein [Acidobacteriota bacterium]
MAVPLGDIAAFLNSYLDIDVVPDASLNGLQVEASGQVERLAMAVDAAAETITMAAADGCQLMIVHHGLFWGDRAPLSGRLGARVGQCYASGLSVYAAHLPLDLHPEVGNNVLLAEALEAQPESRFGDHGGVKIGMLARFPDPLPLATVAGRLSAVGCDDQMTWAFGAEEVSTIAVVTGSGCSVLDEVVALGADCFITGEPRHSAYHDAREAGLNCIFAGHYATETFGVRAVGDLVAERFAVEAGWIDHPTGV